MAAIKDPQGVVMLGRTTRPTARLENDFFWEQRVSRVELQEPHRELYFCQAVELEGSDYTEGSNERVRAMGNDANLIASRLSNGLHAPVIDIDLPVRLIPSRTEGHFHLYFDHEMSWWKYRLLLWAMKVAGLVEPGYYRASVSRRMSMCRWNIVTHFRATTGEQMATAAMYALKQKIHDL